MSYLDSYGVKDARREKIFKRAALGLFLAGIAALLLYFQFRNYTEEQRVKAFLAHLRAGDHTAAYALWGCTAETPCPQYAFDKFMEDWGPQSPMKDPNAARIVEFRGCDTGVIGIVQAPSQQENIQLWVDRRTQEIGFAPWQLKQVPSDMRSRLANLFWKIAQDCRPLIGP